MILRSAVSAALILGLAASAGAAPAKTSTIDLGSAKLYTQVDEGASIAGLQLSLDAGLDRQTAAQNGLAALAAEVVLATPVDGVPLRSAIAARGASIVSSVGTEYVRFYLEGAPAALAAASGLTARALASPDTSDATLAAARAALGAKIAEDQRNPVSIGIAMVRRSYYDGAAGMSALGTPATVATFTGADVKAFIAANYLGADATVTAVGNVTDDVTSAAKTLAAALGGGAHERTAPTVHPIPANPKRIVTQREIGVPYVVLGFAAPAVGSKDFGAMLILRSLLSDIFDRQSATTLPNYARGVGTVYQYDTNPATFAVYINGAQIDPTQGLGSIDAVLRGIALKPFTPVLLSRYRASARGEWQTESISLQDRAWSLGTFVELGAGPDYAQTALAAIDAATSVDVQRVAKTYLQHYTVALVIPRERNAPQN